MNKFRLLFLLGLFCCCWHSSVLAESPTTSPSATVRRLKVAVYDRPPYSFKDQDGAWSGLSIDLWEKIAGQLGVAYDYVEVPLPEIYQKLHDGICDLTPVSAISSERTKDVEFTQPYLFSHGAVVTLHKSFLETMKSLCSYVWNKEVLLILFMMNLGMVAFSFLLVLIERKYQQGHFGGPSAEGFGSALWFSAVTMTTVGYGDKTPLSAAGRIITFFWMLVGVLLIALFTGTVASSITTAQIQSGLVRFDDISRFRVGCMEGSRMDLLLANRGIPAIRYPNPEAGLAGFVSKKINAYAGDSVSLEYLITHDFPGKFRMSIIPDSAMMFAFATRPNLPELAHINHNLLQITLAPDWRSKLERWTGPLSF